jgi:hypothetical protein
MKTLRAAIVLFAVLEAGWIAFDGARALSTGEYLKPRLGGYGGHLGEWTRVASALGAPPRSAAAKSALLGYGVLWILVACAYARGAGGAWWLLFVLAAGALWYSILAVPLSLASMLLLVAARRDA